MRLVAGLLLVSMISPASAQERMFTITITETQLNYIGKILGKQPYEDSVQTLDSIKAQVAARLNSDLAAERDRLRKEFAPAEEPKP